MQRVQTIRIYMLIVVFVSFIFNMGCVNKGQEPTKNRCEIDITIDNERLVYTIRNKNEECVFVPEDYYVAVRSNDTIILEAYPKSDLINYNQFIAPKMSCVLKDGIEKGEIYSSNLREGNYFMRIFQKDAQKYFSKNKIDPLTEQDFIEFEKQYSELIKVSVN